MAIAWPEYLPEVDGERRFQGSRVTPWVLLHFYNNLGYSAEMLATEFPSVNLVIVHKFLAFYMENAAEIDAQAASEDAEMDRLRAASPDHVALAELRNELTSCSCRALQSAR